jgi:hypothetical protein
MCKGLFVIEKMSEQLRKNNRYSLLFTYPELVDKFEGWRGAILKNKESALVSRFSAFKHEALDG